MNQLSDEQILAKGKKVLEIEVAELTRMEQRLGASFVAAVRLLVDTVSKGGKILILGVGKSGHIGEKISATFASTGCVSTVLNSLNALHGDLGIVQDGDLLIALSYSGETEELVKILSVVRRFSVKIIGITGGTRSTLAKLCDVAVDVAVEQEACPLQLAPTSSTTNMLALGDALAMVVLEAKGVSTEEFSRYHPGGRLGRVLLTKVSEVMRPRSEITIVKPNDLVRDVLRMMIEKKSGAAIVEGQTRREFGIFTHGDFIRHFSQESNIANDKVGVHMTPNPIRIAESAFAIDALALFRQHRVDEIVVVDEHSQVCGIVDVQDLSRHRII